MMNEFFTLAVKIIIDVVLILIGLYFRSVISSLQKDVRNVQERMFEYIRTHENKHYESNRSGDRDSDRLEKRIECVEKKSTRALERVAAVEARLEMTNTGIDL